MIVGGIDDNGKDVGNNNCIANINPYHYRFYYDEETKLYYLESRYYSPEIGRFINADSCDVILDSPSKSNNYLDCNLYNYAYNNPVNMIDPDGHNPLLLQTILAVLRRLGSWVVRIAWPVASRWFRKHIFNILKRNKSSYGGIKVGPVSIMLHKPHTGKHNYYHIQIEVRYGRRKHIYRIRLWI